MSPVLLILLSKEYSWGRKKGGPMLSIGVLVVTVAFELACLAYVMTPAHTRKH
jgi:hypothetical protein